MELLFVGFIALFFVPAYLRKRNHKPKNNRIEQKDTVVQRTKIENKYTEREFNRAKKTAYDAVYNRCKEMAENSEVAYFSLDDIKTITDELKYNK